MAFNKQSSDTLKQYFWLSADRGNNVKEWTYVTADAVATVDGSAYITDSEMLDTLNMGDLVWVYQVASVSDSRTIQGDMAAGITDISLHAVLENTGSVIDLSNDLLSATVTYGD